MAVPQKNCLFNCPVGSYSSSAVQDYTSMNACCCPVFYAPAVCVSMLLCNIGQNYTPWAPHLCPIVPPCLHMVECVWDCQQHWCGTVEFTWGTTNAQNLTCGRLLQNPGDSPTSRWPQLKFLATFLQPPMLVLGFQPLFPDTAMYPCWVQVRAP